MHLASSISAERLTRSGTAIFEGPHAGWPARAVPSPTITEVLQARYPDLLPPPRNPIRASAIIACARPRWLSPHAIFAAGSHPELVARPDRPRSRQAVPHGAI